MRRILRWVLRVTAGLAVLLVLAAGALAAALWHSLPGGSHSATIPGLVQGTTVELDDDAIPRIRAASLRDAAATLGYLHARERLFQMDLTRRAAAGELSEIAGTATLANDRLMRTLGVRQSAERDAAALDADTRALLESYAAGVNAWIARRGRFAAAEFIPLGTPRPWTPTDSLLWAKTMGLYLSSNWRTELARAKGAPAPWPPTDGTASPHAAIPPDPALAETATRLAALLPAFPAPFTQPDSASNAWAVDARHSATGAPLLAGDPHLAFAMPGIWYLARIDTPEGSLVGATAPGVPFLVMGHNGRIAWSFTTTGADVQDLFVETPAGPNLYLGPDGPRPFVIREERIRIRGQPDEVLTVRETRHGPVISDLAAPDGPILSIAMANLAPGDTSAAGLLALNRAPDRAAAGRAAAAINGLVQNMTVADRNGIALYVTGRIPLRRAGDGSRPAPGADGSHDWTGFANGPDLPRITDPPSGRVLNANERIAPPDFPVFLGRDWHDDLRARRARELLAATPKHTQDGFAAMQVDTLSVFARDALPRLATVPVTGALASRAQLLLAGWDAHMRPDAPQPLIFHEWMRAFATLLAPGDGAAPWWNIAAHALSPEGAATCGTADRCTALLGQALETALPPLAARFGPDPAAWRWGEPHQAVFAHPILRAVPQLAFLSTVRVPVGGDATTLLRANTGRTLDAVHGAGFRAVHDLANLDRSRFIATPGQSGHLLLATARNFAARWQQGDLLTIPPRPARVAARLILTPEAPPP
jgi:penicillin amidase